MNLMTAIQKGGRKPWVRWLLCIAGAVAFLGLAYVVIYHNKDLWHLWQPASSNNDEVIYNRQLVGVLQNGQPQGVFGYNEGRAWAGHFGAWGPVLILLYAIPGVLVGAGVNTMFWCNIFFAVAGWALFAMGTGLSWKKQLLFAGMVVCAWFPLQQVFTGAAEPLQFFLILAIVGASAALQRKFYWGWVVVLFLACALTTVTRAYTVLFWIFPVVLLWKHHRRLAIGSVAGAVVSTGGYLAVSKLFSAAFFSSNTIDFAAFSLLMEGKIFQAVAYAMTHLADQCRELWRDALAPVLQGEFQELGLTAWLVLFLLAVTAAVLVWDARHKRPVVFKACAVTVVGIGLLGLLEMYAMYAMSRHFIMLSVVLLAVLVYEDRFAGWLCLPLLVVLPYHLTNSVLPVYNAEMDSQMQIVAQALSAREEAQQNEDPWAHTLAYAFRDDVFHGYLYAVPAGMGIQFDQNTYLANAENPIHSQYVMVGHGSEAETRLVTDGWQELVSTEDLVVYEKPEGLQ